MTSNDTSLDELQEIVDYKIKQNNPKRLSISSIAGLQTALNAKVDVVAGKALQKTTLLLF